MKKNLLAAILLSSFAVVSFAQAPAAPKEGMHKHHHHHHHHQYHRHAHKVAAAK